MGLCIQARIHNMVIGQQREPGVSFTNNLLTKSFRDIGYEHGVLYHQVRALYHERTEARVYPCNMIAA